jgi:hypothetical protein
LFHLNVIRQFFFRITNVLHSKLFLNNDYRELRFSHRANGAVAIPILYSSRTFGANFLQRQIRIEEKQLRRLVQIFKALSLVLSRPMSFIQFQFVTSFLCSASHNAASLPMLHDNAPAVKSPPPSRIGTNIRNHELAPVPFDSFPGLLQNANEAISQLQSYLNDVDTSIADVDTILGAAQSVNVDAIDSVLRPIYSLSDELHQQMDDGYYGAGEFLSLVKDIDAIKKELLPVLQTQPLLKSQVTAISTCPAETLLQH